MKRIFKYITQYDYDVVPLIINCKSRNLDEESICDESGFDSDLIDVAGFIEEEIIPVAKGQKKYSLVSDKSTYPKLCILENFHTVLGKEKTAQELFWVLTREYNIIIIMGLGQSYQMPFTHSTYIDEYDGDTVSDYYHIICDDKDYQMIRTEKKLPFCKEENVACFDFHMEIEAFAETELRAMLLAFISNYDGLFLGESQWWCGMMQRTITEILEASREGRKIVLWHKQEGYQTSFYYIVSLLKEDRGAEALLEGANILDCLDQYECEGLDLTEREFVDKYTKEISVEVSSNENMYASVYDCYDEAILAEFEKSDEPISPKEVVSTIAKRYNLWIPFIIFRLVHLRDKGLLKVIKTHPILEMAHPQIYFEKWVRNFDGVECDVLFEYDTLKRLLLLEHREWEEEMYMDTLLHELPMTHTSLEFIEECMDEAIDSYDKKLLIACCLIRLRDLLTDDERSAWMKRFTYLE